MKNPFREHSNVNPQPPGNGDAWRGINKSIWNALTAARLPGAVFQVVLCIIDRSWGYGEIEVSLGYSQICKATRLSKRAVITAVEIAEKNRLLVIDHGDTRTMKPNRYLFNKYYDTWVTSEAYSTSEVERTSTSEVNDTRPSEVATHKPSFLKKKENIKENYYQEKNNKGVTGNGVNKDRQGFRKKLPGPGEFTDPESLRIPYESVPWLK